MFKILLSLIIILMFGCVTRMPSSVKTKMTHQLPSFSKNDNIYPQIQFDGLYRIFDKNIRYYGYNPQERVDSTALYFMFFEDGLFAYNFHLKKQPNDLVLDLNNFYLLKDGSLNANFWGIFERNGDSILVQILHKPLSSNDSWGFRSLSFQILNDSTLILNKDMDLLGKNETDSIEDPIRSYSTAQFIKAINLPSPKNWLKKEKWLWQNPEAWEKYMKEIGKKTK